MLNVPTKEQFFIEAIRHFCSSLDITTALRRLFDYLSVVMPLDYLTIGVMELELKRFRQIAETTAKYSIYVNDNYIVHDKIIEFSRSWGEYKPTFFNDVAADDNLKYSLDGHSPHLREMFADKKISSLNLRLLIDGAWIGSINMLASGVNQYTQEHADLLEPLQEPFALVLSNCLQFQEVVRLQEVLTEDNRHLRQELQETSNEVIGKNHGLKNVMEIAAQTAPRENPVLLLGETGTGKEVIANAIHYSSPRRNKPFVTVNCGAIPDSLIDSELFGHEKGAFTGAVKQKRGRFERADRGTIFLDEIGELPPKAQVRLLRVIQNKEIERVGGTETLPVDIRIIAATHRDLSVMVEKNEFREDLYYRLNVLPIVIPPLRQRKIDIPEFVRHFLDKKAKELKLKQIPKLAPGTLEPLIAYGWPGNVRELENVVERALIRYRGGLLSLDDFLSPQDQAKNNIGPDPLQIPPFDQMVKEYILQALRHTGGKISGENGAATLMGMHPNTLRGKMKKLELLSPKNRLRSRKNP